MIKDLSTMTSEELLEISQSMPFSDIVGNIVEDEFAKYCIVGVHLTYKTVTFEFRLKEIKIKDRWTEDLKWPDKITYTMDDIEKVWG